MSADQPLAGGLGNVGRVVRRHDTVRRPTGPWTPSVHLLLDHLHRVGFDGAPQVLAVDDNTEVLEFVDVDPGRAGVDMAARFALFADAHALDRRDRDRVLDALVTFLDRALVSVRTNAAAGHVGHRAQWEAGYEAANRRARTWIGAHRHLLQRA